MGVFISYRRDETTAYAHLLHYVLNDRLNGVPVFMDLHAIDPGEDFVPVIQQAVTNCLVLLVLIGPHWGSLRDTDGQLRLHNPDDFVRVELETALNDPETLVIPVLVERAGMPRSKDLPASLAGLCRRQALELGHVSFQHDLRRLLDTVERRLRTEPGPSRPASPRGRGVSRERPGRMTDPAEVAITHVGPVKRWRYRWPDASVERYHTTTRYTVTDDQGDLDVLVACGHREAYGKDRGRIVIFGNGGGASSSYYPWTEFVETDDGEYAAKLYNPADPRKSLKDGDSLPPRFARVRVRRNDAVFRSVRNGPALRLVVKPDDEHAMIRHGHWAAKLRQAI